MNPIEAKFRATVEKYRMLNGKHTVIAGFSGGADSSAMLVLLLKLCKEKGIRLVAVHVNHLIRGEDAFKDEEHCRNFCLERDIEFVAERRDIPSLAAEKKQGLEECARDVRYKIFEDKAAEFGADAIATAHNAGDNLETVIFNLCRGASIKGLCGIPPVRGNIIRPLIALIKSEITDYCNENKIDYVTDSTNSDEEYTRNFIRHRIVPKMRQLNPSCEKNVLLSCECLRECDELVEKIAGEYEKPLSNDAPFAIVKRVFRNEYGKFSDPSNLTSYHYNAALELVRAGNTGAFVSLPGKLRVRFGKDGKFIFDSDTREKMSRQEGNFNLKVGVNVISELDCAIVIKPVSDCESYMMENIYKLSMKGSLYFDTMSDIDTLYCRARIQGDSYRFGNMTRSVKKLLNSRKEIDSCHKLNYPVICDGNGIVLLPGFSVRDSEKNKKLKYSITVYMIKEA